MIDHFLFDPAYLAPCAILFCEDSLFILYAWYLVRKWKWSSVWFAPPPFYEVGDKPPLMFKYLLSVSKLALILPSNPRPFVHRYD